VDELKVAWTFRTGEPDHRSSEDMNTPMQVGDRVYVCPPGNVVIALDADTGKEIWRHDPKVKKGFWNRCRGVGYRDGTQPRVAVSADIPAAPVVTRAVVAKSAPCLASPALAQAAVASAAPLCRRRILVSTINAQLIALDAATGVPCPGFGVDGKVDLSTGKLLWQGRLPVGAGGTPMSYLSPKTGKQYVVASAGGARLRPARGDYVIAYALP
jgi:quinate dehydrogenase (quinone)